MSIRCTDVMTVAARDNNSIRPYIYVNPLQGKHIPVSPSRSLELFSMLADIVSVRYKSEQLLIVGFAETATAIGSSIAWYANNVKYYISTTRENIPGSSYISFTESHSHAKDQRLSDNKLKECLLNVDRIVFAEDEVTTGNTIEKCMAQFADQPIKFGIISVLNSMSDERLEHFSDIGVQVDFLFHVENSPVTPVCEFLPPVGLCTDRPSIMPRFLDVANLWNERIITKTEELRSSTSQFANEILEHLNISENDKKILVLGTEEFMFPAMYLGSLIEDRLPASKVKFHATTRSPILVSSDSDYPLRNRSVLESFYESGRQTSIYNLERYNKVIIATDAEEMVPDGVNSLVNALVRFGNTDITVIRWRP